MMHHALHFVGQAHISTPLSTSSKGLLLALVLVYLALIIFFLYTMSKVYMKAGRKWWEAIVPIYNNYVLLQIVGRPGWWLVLFFIPFVGIIFAIITVFDLAKSFGRGTGTGLLLLFFSMIMYPVMAFSSKYQYQGPSASNSAGSGTDAKPATTTPDSQTTTSDTTGPQPPASTEPAPPAPEIPTSTPPTNPAK